MAACNFLGLMYATGDEVPQDLARAIVFYEQACDGGELAACTNLAMMVQAGEAQDPSRAAILFQRACDGGELLACDNLRAMDPSAADVVVRGFPRSGRVADRETRDPLSGTIVEVPELGIRMLSDDAGRVDFGRLPAGQYRLTAERFGYDRIVDGELEVPWNSDFLILLDRAAVDDPEAPGRILGRVTEEGRSGGLSNVEVTVLSPVRTGTVTNQAGRFDLRGLEPGLVELEFTRLGYTPRTTTLIVQPGVTVQVDALMSTQAIELEGFEVTVTVRSRWLEQNGFYRRAQRPWGSQFARTDLDKIDPIDVSDVIWRVAGVGSQFDPRSQSRVIAINLRSRCTLPVWIDGVRQVDADLNQMPADWIEAIEIYHGVGTPIEYSDSRCGAVLIWTRRGNN